MGLHKRYEEILQSAHLPVTLDKDTEDSIRRQVTKAFGGMMSALYEQKGANLDISILASDRVQDYISTHASALNSSFSTVPMSDAMRQRLTRSDYIFSGMKAFHELNEAFPSLLDENGERKTFERFLNDVQKIDNTYNGNYLRAEYNFVQASAEMAAKWEQYTEDGDRYYLQYRTANDGKVRPEHAALHNVTLPMSDPFWETYYPPNGWNCRCTVVQVRKSKYTPTPHDEAMSLGEEALQRDTKGIFRFNPGKEQKSVPDYNPYTIKRCRDCDKSKLMKLVKIPDNELCAACAVVHKCFEAKKDGDKRKEPEQFYECDVKDGRLRVSSWHGSSEKENNIMVGKYLAEKYGYSIDLISNPPSNPSADSMNHTLGYTQEYKVCGEPTYNAVDKLLRSAKRQSDHVILWMNSDIPLGVLASAIKSRVKKTSCKTVTVIKNGKDCTYTRAEIVKDSFKIQQADLN